MAHEWVDTVQGFVLDTDAVAKAKLFTPPFIAFFIGAICHIIFTFMAKYTPTLLSNSMRVSKKL